MKNPTSMRLSGMTRQQIRELAQATGLNQTEIVSVSIDRMYRSEFKSKTEEKMNGKTLLKAVERMIEKLPNWREDAVIYRRENGDYECDPQSVYETVSREHAVEKIIRVHDLEEFGGGAVGADDALWIAEQIKNGG